MAKVFISYRHVKRDEALANQLVSIQWLWGVVEEQIELVARHVAEYQGIIMRPDLPIREQQSGHYALDLDVFELGILIGDRTGRDGKRSGF